jgi:acetone carboxylase, beta subunit
MIEAYAAAPVRVQLEKVERSIHNEGFKAELQTVLSYGGLANIRHPRLHGTLVSGPVGCNVPSAKLCLSQNSLHPSPLVSNSLTSRLISWRLRRFRTLTPSFSVTPTVHQKRARSTRWVRLKDTV